MTALEFQDKIIYSAKTYFPSDAVVFTSSQSDGFSTSVVSSRSVAIKEFVKSKLCGKYEHVAYSINGTIINSWSK